MITSPGSHLSKTHLSEQAAIPSPQNCSVICKDGEGLHSLAHQHSSLLIREYRVYVIKILSRFHWGYEQTRETNCSMGFGNPRGQLAKLMLPRTIRKSSDEELHKHEGGDTDEDQNPVPLVLTHRLNVGSSVEPNDAGVSVPMDAMGMPDFHLASPSPKGGNCQKKFFDDSKEQPWMLENRLKGLFLNFRPHKQGGFPIDTTVRNSPKRNRSSKRSLVPSLHSPRDRSQEEVDERTHLILDAAIADEWSERQLAFDLESVVEDTSSSLMWMIHSEDDEDVTLSSPPPECRSLTIDTGFESDLDPPVARRRHRRHNSRRRLLQYSPKLATVYEEEDEDSSKTCDTEFFSFDEDSLDAEICSGTNDIEEL